MQNGSKVSLDVRCECGRVYHSSSEHVGKQIKCTNCGRLVEIKIRSEAAYTSNRHRFPRWGLWAALASLAVLVVGVYLAIKTGRANTNSGTVTPNPAAADCPSEPHSLLNGARLQPDVGTSGKGKLTVDNGTSDDATVELVNTGSDYTSRYAYVQANHKLTLTGIEVGTYDLMFTSGANWVGDDFTCSPSYSEFEKELVYSESVVANEREFHEMSVTLHEVPEGNVKTRTISRADFHRRTQGRSNSTQ